MKLWIQTTLLTVLLLSISGCGAKPAPKKEAIIDATLPIVQLTKDGIFVDMNAIAFEWKSFSDPRVKGVYVYKVTHGFEDEELKYYATVNSRFATHYVDDDIKPDTKYSYEFKTFTDETESRKSSLTITNSLPVLDSVSWIFSIENMPRSAKVIWRPHTNQKVKSYIIERKTLEEDNWVKIDTVDGRLNSEYIDTNLKDEYTYKYRIRVLTYDNITSFPSEMVKVVTKALPNSVKKITATSHMPKRIKVEWKASTAKDFSRYYVYRSLKVEDGYELVAKLHNNVFIDNIDVDGKEYFYRVSVVDTDNLESKYKNKSIMGVTLTKPSAPALIEAKLINNTVEILWSKTDPRTISYVVEKRYKRSWVEEITEEFEGVMGEKFIDINIEPDTKYFYKVYSLDQFAIKSEPSIEISLKSKPAPEVKTDSQPTKEDGVIVDTPSQSAPKTKDVVNPVQDLSVSEL